MQATTGVLPGEEQIIGDLAWIIYGAASDTTISATRSFLYLTAIHPEVQRTDRKRSIVVIGNSRLPDFNDRPRLPCIEAVYHELMRHSPPLPLGIPHGLTKDDVYEGYFLPQGSAIVTNIWAMTHDENGFADPFSFKPERFLDVNGQMKEDSRILQFWQEVLFPSSCIENLPFDRICAGKNVASNFMWLVIVSFLACFNIGKARDETGNEIEIDGTYYDIGVVSHKKPFKCSITPQSQKSRQLVEGSLGSERYD